MIGFCKYFYLGRVITEAQKPAGIGVTAPALLHTLEAVTVTVKASSI